VNAYRSRFANWDHTASVRSRPRPLLNHVVPQEIYFPPELVAVYSHPLVAARGDTFQKRVLIHTLYQYLHFTSELEDLAVLPVAMNLSRGKSGLSLPAGVRRDAYNIVTDEAWHAQFSAQLLQDVARHTGETVPDFGEPMFVARLKVIEAELDTHVPNLGKLLFAIVSETLISALLAGIPHDPRLPPAVRQTVADHAIDEGRHHAYFKDILVYLWADLTRAERAQVGPWIPMIILAFLEPDYQAVCESLRLLGLGADETEAVLTESFPRASVLANAGAAAKSTIRYVAELGGLREPATADAFAIFGPLSTSDELVRP